MASIADDGTGDETLIQSVVRALLENFDCQPVLFVGAGMSRRYIDTPDWEGILRYALAQIGGITISYEYLAQKYNDNKVLIGSEIADLTFEWAWGNGKNSFDATLFSSKDKSIFMKAIIASRLQQLTPTNVVPVDPTMQEEIAALKAIRPHALITTNFDHMLESIFQGYESIIGKNVLKYNLNAYGEVYHLHGSASNPSSLIVTYQDYETWHDESRYFAAKLLTYFVEHPVFIFGYGLGDPNIQTVLRDIGKIVADDTGLINNVIQVIWHSDAEFVPHQSESAIPVDGVQFRIRVLHVNSIIDVLQSLTARHELANVNPTLVRALAARVMKLTRRDIPNGNIEIDYATLESLSSSDDALPKVLGITENDNVNKTHPYTLGVVAEKLGFDNWNYANRLLRKIKDDTGVDIKVEDSKYHCAVKTGKAESSVSRKYSPELVMLLAKVRDGEEYVL